MQPLKPFDIALSGINLVEASAGTGKTYNITSLYIRALIEQELAVGKILVVTYTEAATKELKDRLLKRIRESIRVLRRNAVSDSGDQFLEELLQQVQDRTAALQKLEKAIRAFDEAAIYTIHGFCYQALQEQAFESRAMYDAEMIGDDSELVLEAVDDYWRNWVDEATDDPRKRPLLQFIIGKGYTPDKLAFELGSYLGQPHLQVLPEDMPSREEIYDRVSRLREIFAEMKSHWRDDRAELRKMVYADQLDGRVYITRYMESWIDQLEEFLKNGDPPFDLFEQFKKFRQSFLNDSLTASSRKKGLEAPQHSFFELADTYQEVAETLKEYEIFFKKELLDYLSVELQQKKEELQVLSYDDLLLRLRDALYDPRRGERLARKLRQKYPLALVDEFQDTDPNQYDIFRKMYGNGQGALFMIGDPKQSIYSFRGADVFSYLQAKEDARSDQTFDLDRNFRSVPELLSGLNTLFGKHESPFILDKIPYEQVKPGRDEKNYSRLTEKGKQRPPIRFHKVSLGEEEQLNKSDAARKAVRDTANEIYRMIEAGKRGEASIGEDPVRAKDIAVLVRTHRQATQVGEALRERGIKSVQYSQESVFKSEEAGHLEKWLKAVAEPANERLVKTALALPLAGYTANDLLKIEEDEQRWIGILDQFDQWHRQWQELGFSAMFRSVLNEADIAQHLITFADGERRLTNLLHLGELLQEEARHQKDGTRGLLKWLTRKRKEEKVDRDEEQLRLESDQELVKIVTMHRSKGLEYPIVFCPFLWYGPRFSDNGQPLVYHDPGDLNATYLNLQGKNDPDRSYKRLLVAREELAESLRLAYVAMTRAKQCCYLTWAYADKTEFSPLAYLLLDPDTTTDRLQETIEKSYRALGEEPYKKAVTDLCESYPELFTQEKSAGHSGTERQLELIKTDKSLAFNNRIFERELPLKTSYSVSSFSSLSSWMEDGPDLPDYDQFLEEFAIPEAIEVESTDQTMFTFPKGPQPGTCIHKIFEDIDFRDDSDHKEIIRESLQMYGIDVGWQPVVRRMVTTVLDKALHPREPELRLSELKQSELVQEMEFYYQTQNIETNRLLSIIRGQDVAVTAGKAEQGFLKGFIDLTFRHGDKYYLLDYKTNYLGDGISDYESSSLQEEMREASYDLQYHIYTVALHRYLKRHLPEYHYEQNFGGAFYLFLRGMNTDGREGIFFDCPKASTIEQLDEYISRGGGRNE